MRSQSRTTRSWCNWVICRMLEGNLAAEENYTVGTHLGCYRAIQNVRIPVSPSRRRAWLELKLGFQNAPNGAKREYMHLPSSSPTPSIANLWPSPPNRRSEYARSPHIHVLTCGTRCCNSGPLGDVHPSCLVSCSCPDLRAKMAATRR